MRSLLRNVLMLCTASVVLLVLALTYYATKDYSDYFRERRGILTRTSVRLVGTDSLYEKSWLSLENEEGFSVECGMLVPRGGRGRYPAIILLGGKATGKYAVDYALDVRDVIIVSPDYPFEPRQSYTIPQFIGDVPTIRRALIDMIPSVMLVTDYLFQRRDVDTTRLVLLGYSFGAPFVPCIAAHDRRSAVAAMVYGGGELGSLIRHNVRRYEGPLVSELAGILGGLLLRPLEPMRYIEAVSPTPLIMINGARDEQIPRENTELLYNRARQPKKIVWLESKHVNPANTELTRQIITTLRAELAGMGILGVHR